VVLSCDEPQLLRRDWFHPEVAYCLRRHLRHMLLGIMLEQATDKELPGAVAAVADREEYSSQLALHRKAVQDHNEE
jgi:hypothetical protein